MELLAGPLVGTVPYMGHMRRPPPLQSWEAFLLKSLLAWFDLLWDQCDEPVDFFSESSPGETGPFSEELGRGELESCGN